MAGNAFRMDPGALAKIKRLGEQARNRALREIAEDARRNAPVDTGELASSIRVDGDTVVAGADHGGYVELGTEHMRAQPYLRPSLYKRRNLRPGT